MKKPFIVANVREVLDLYDKEEISFSRMVEMLNEIAEKFYNPKEVARKNIKDCDNCVNFYTYETCFSCTGNNFDPIIDTPKTK